MRNLYLIIFLFTIVLIIIGRKCLAQHTYIPIPEYGGTWIVSVEDYNEGSGDPHTFDYVIGITTGIDTIVNGINYFCYYGDASSGNLPFPPGPYPANAGIWFKQDSQAKKVWRVFSQTQPETSMRLLYDFSLQIGDTINDSTYVFISPQELWPYKAWIHNIDSLFFPDGSWRYRWTIRSEYGFGNSEAIMVEGVGYITGFQKDPFSIYRPVITESTELSCFRVNTDWLYEVPNYWGQDCDSMIDHNILSFYSISNALHEHIFYPNPIIKSSELIFSQLANREDCMVSAYNFRGEMIFKERYKPGSRIDLNKYQLTNGLYLFIAYDLSGKMLHSQKIEIE